MFGQLGHSEFIAYIFCRQLQVSITRSTIKQHFEDQPNSNSLLSLSDVLTKVGIQNLAGRVEMKNLDKLPSPSIAQISLKGKKFFTIISKMQENYVIYLDPVSQRFTTVTKNVFGTVFTGISLVGSVLEGAGERNYSSKRLVEKKNISRRSLLLQFYLF